MTKPSSKCIINIKINIFYSVLSEVLKVGRTVLNEIANKYNVGIDAAANAWLLVHPVNFIVVLGSGKIDRIKSALRGLEIKLTREEWFKIWIASKGNEVP